MNLYIVKRTFRRTNNLVLFFEDKQFNNYQDKMYNKTIAHNHSIEEDDCKRHIQVFYNEEQYQRWADDPTVRQFNEKMSLYNKDNDISFNEIKASV